MAMMKFLNHRLLSIFFALLLLPLIHAAPGLRFKYRSLSKTDGFLLQQNATRSAGGSAIWLTPDTRTTSDYSSLTSLIGRVVYRKPLKLGALGWSAAGARFRTQFTFQLVTSHTSYGGAADGLAFFLAPTAAVPLGSQGEYLGIDDPSSNSSTDRLFAVEFDTYQNSYDPSASHVGIDINTVESIATVDTSDSESPYYLYGDYVFRAWIEYDASNDHEIRVWLDNCSQSKRACSKVPTSRPPLLHSNYDLSAIFSGGQSIYVGISATTGGLVEGALIYSWAFDAYA